ncbi:MAG: hypothetical protein ACOYJL_09065 [Tractidigestivibacter sp.]|uniref:hypothetical protein n=1 Tax=Tractidigestivibacter sp. TaxID=2847320 RepID=UPI003D90B419
MSMVDDFDTPRESTAESGASRDEWTDTNQAPSVGAAPTGAPADETAMPEYGGESPAPAEYDQREQGYERQGYEQDPSQGPQQGEQNQQPAGGEEAQPRRYTRARPAHRTVAPIDDLADDEDSERFTHDSSYSNRGGLVSGRSYRRSRSEMTQLRRDLHYGQYLEIPKGRRDIFASRERKSRIRSTIALIVVIVVLAVVVYFVWQYMQINWGATG